MEASCIRHSDLPGASRLFLDLVYHYDRVADLYPHAATPAALARSVADISYPDSRRAALVAALAEQNGSDHPALATLARPDAVAVVTGQQVGLFSGPAYTVYKAITASRIARRLTEQGTPAVPVFWLATEDHDFEEINHAWVFDPNHCPHKLAVAYDNRTHTPVGRIPLPAPPMAELRAALEGFPHADEVAGIVAAAYVQGRPMGEAFQRLLERLLVPLGLLFLDPLRRPVRAIAAPLLAQAIRTGDTLARRLLDRNRELEARGYHAQVLIEPDTSLFFLLEGADDAPPSRVTLKRANGGYAADGRTWSVDALAGRAERLSPNALLRPVMQDYLLPTAAYVGGPAELAYLAQSRVLYDELLGRMPVALPRSGFTLLDARAAKLFRRWQLRIADFAHGEAPLKETIARRLVPETVASRFDRTESGVAALLEELRAELEGFDPTLAAASAKSAAKMRYQLSKMRAKIARETLRRDQRAAGDAVSLAGLVYPHRHLQERFYSMIPFLAQHGLDLVERLYEAARPECPDHTLVAL